MSGTPLAGQYEQTKLRIAAACARAGREVASVRLVAVTKMASAGQIREAVELGMRDLGENRVQVFAEHARELAEGLRDRPELLSQVRWHMIGHLQRNKVADAMGLASLFHTVDSVRLAGELATQAGKRGLRAGVLVQVNAGREAQKYGVSLEAAAGLCRDVAGMGELDLCGLMAMAPLTDDRQVVRDTFARTRTLFEQIRGQLPAAGSFRELSMGMSQDFEIAIEEGATLVRIGSLLFGQPERTTP